MKKTDMSSGYRFGLNIYKLFLLRFFQLENLLPVYLGTSTSQTRLLLVY